MKRKIVNPNIQEKKRQQAVDKELNKDLKKELNEERSIYPKKRKKQSSQTKEK